MARPHPLSRSILPTAGPSSLSSQAYDPTPSSPSAAPFARHHARPLKRSRLNPAAAASSATAPSLGSEAARKSAPAPPAVDFTAAQASGALQRVIASALAEAGFDGAQADVLWAVEDQVVSWMNLLLSSAKDRSEQLGRRTRPNARDLFAATVADGHLTLDELSPAGQEGFLLRGKPVASESLYEILPPPAPPPAFLPLGFEPLPSPTTSTSGKPSKHALPPLPYAPAHLPPLPPAHSYKATPAPSSPPRPDPATRAADIAELEERYGQTRTVERALVRLIDRTTHAGKEGSIEEGLRDLGLGVVGWRVRERKRGSGAV